MYNMYSLICYVFFMINKYFLFIINFFKENKTMPNIVNLKSKLEELGMTFKQSSSQFHAEFSDFRFCGQK